MPSKYRPQCSKRF